MQLQRRICRRPGQGVVQQVDGLLVLRLADEVGDPLTDAADLVNG